MTKDLKLLIDKNNFTNYCQLDSIQSKCPWKKYEGLTTKEFIDKNFFSIKKHTNIFHEVIATHCLDVVFVEIYTNKLQKLYWFCVYYLGNDENGNPKYYIGGEPEESVPLQYSLKENSNLSNFPNSLKEFWSIHGIWDVALSYGKMDFNISFLSEKLYPEEGEGKVPHYTTLNTTGNEIGIADWVALQGGQVSIDDLGETDFDFEETFDLVFFVEEYLKKGVYFMTANGDVVLLLESYQGFPNFFYLCHDCGSNFYSSFWEYLATELSA